MFVAKRRPIHSPALQSVCENSIFEILVDRNRASATLLATKWRSNVAPGANLG
jgi:hypothetical protein